MTAYLYRFTLGLLIVAILCSVSAFADSHYGSPKDFAKYAMKLREKALNKVEPQVHVQSSGTRRYASRFPWKRKIVTTVFWVGEQPTANNPVPNTASSWDRKWMKSFGGYDDPKLRAKRDFRPAAFIPKENPFYVALPYNDVMKGGRTKPEAAKVIPWFRRHFVKKGHTVLKGRWLAIRKGNRVCYAQWEDCGPFRTDHWQYVFGNARPRWNLNKGAGLDVSPAVRDYLGMKNTDVTDWRFVEAHEVPRRGPWAKYGRNNPLAAKRSQAESRHANLKKSGDHTIRR